MGKEPLTVSRTNVSAPTSFKRRLTVVGPGLIVAATGVGAGDLVAALVAGTNYGMTLLWAIVIGSLLKFYLNEGVGRWHLATGQTILQGWHSLGRLATGYFGVYSVIWGFVFGAAVASSCALAMTAMFPVMPLWAWAAIHSIVGFLLIWTGSYQFFERLITVLVGLMFVTVVGSAVFVFPGLGELAGGMVPRVPEGSFLNTLGLIGGVGGTITMAAYGYWLREKDWKGQSWIPTMRLDISIAYIITAIFTISLLVVGASFLFGTGISISGEQGLVTLADLLGERFGESVRWLFLIGFWAASFTSLLGTWSGVPYLFADFVRTVRKGRGDADKPVSEKSPAYRAYLFWLTFPPMLLLLLGKPVGLIIAYGALGALFMPFLALTLLWLLNSKRVNKEYRNGWIFNSVMVVNVLLFLVLAINELIEVFS